MKKCISILALGLVAILTCSCGGGGSSDGGNNGGGDEPSTISFTIDGNISGGSVIGEQISFTRYNFDYVEDSEQNAMSINVVDNFQDILGTDSYDYITSHEYYNSIYIRISDVAVGTYSFDCDVDESSQMYLRIEGRDGKTYKSNCNYFFKKMMSVNIEESSSNRLKGSFTATLDVFYFQDGGLYYDQEISEEGQLYVNGEFDVAIH